jgi:hypothetical protein
MGYFSAFTTIDYDNGGDGIYDKILDLTNIIKVSDSLLESAVYYDKILVNQGERPDQLSQRIYGTPAYYWTFFVINRQIKNIWNDWPKGSAQLLDYSIFKYADFAALSCACLDPLVGKFVYIDTDGNQQLDYIVGQLSGAVGKILAIHTNYSYITVKLISGTFNPEGENLVGNNTSDVVQATEIVSRAYAPKYHLDDSTGDITAPRPYGTTKVTHLEHESYINDQNSYMKVIKPNMIEEFVAEYRKAMNK